MKRRKSPLFSVSSGRRGCGELTKVLTAGSDAREPLAAPKGFGPRYGGRLFRYEARFLLFGKGRQAFGH
jgi:hypothetical protein